MNTIKMFEEYLKLISNKPSYKIMRDAKLWAEKNDESLKLIVDAANISRIEYDREHDAVVAARAKIWGKIGRLGVPSDSIAYKLFGDSKCFEDEFGDLKQQLKDIEKPLNVAIRKHTKHLSQLRTYYADTYYDSIVVPFLNNKKDEERKKNDGENKRYKEIDYLINRLIQGRYNDRDGLMVKIVRSYMRKTGKCDLNQAVSYLKNTYPEFDKHII